MSVPEEVSAPPRETPALLGLNDRAAAIVGRMIADADGLGIAVSRLSNGATVIDCGARTLGSSEAGRLYAEVCMAGLADVRLSVLDLAGWPTPGVEVSVRQPLLACMASQYAGWAVDVPAQADASGFYALGSGPARSLYRQEPIFDIIAHRDVASYAVLTMEAYQPPTERVASWIAERCGLRPDKLHLLVAPTASLAGSVQVAARIVETGMHKMHRAGFDITTVLSALGSCPVAPVATDDLRAVGRTNDGILYGGRVWYTVRTEDASIEDVIDQLPSMASTDYGVPFGRLYERACAEFYRIDPLLFSPAELWISNVKSGRTFHAGRLDTGLLQQTFFE